MRCKWGWLVLLLVLPAFAQGDDEIFDMIDELVDRDARVRDVAAESLRRLGVRAVPALTETLRSGKDELKVAAARQLGRMGKAAQVALPHLEAATEGTHPELREAAQAALDAIRKEPEPSAPAIEDDLPALLRRLENSSGEERVAVLVIIEEKGAAAAKAVELLIRILDQVPEETTRLAVARALRSIGPPAHPAVPALLRLGASERWALRFAACDAVVAIGQRAVPALFEAWASGDANHRAWLHSAIHELGAIAIPTALAALDRPEKDARVAGAEMLAAIGPGAAGATLALAERLRDPKGAVRRAAARALGAIGADAAEAIPFLIETTKDESSRARLQALEALGAILRDAGSAPKLSRPIAGATLDAQVRAGQDWLAAHQELDGRWDPAGFMRHDPSDDLCDGPGLVEYTVGVTGLALIALVEGGVPEGLDQSVRRGLRYLVSIQQGDGCYGPRAPKHFLYCHGAATVAMCAGWRMTGDPLYRESAQRGLEFIQAARNPEGVWRYEFAGSDGDTSVTGWMVMALRWGEDGGLRVDPAALEAAMRHVDRVTDPKTGRAGYTGRGGGSARPNELRDRFPKEKTRAMTAEASLIRLAMRQDARWNSVLGRSIDQCLEHSPKWEPESGVIDMYYWLMGTRACAHASSVSWRNWAKALMDAVGKHQFARGSGSRTGSWDPIGPWGPDGGRVYSTALMTTSLLVANGDGIPFRRLPPTHSRYRKLISTLRSFARHPDADLSGAAVAGLTAGGLRVR